MADELNKMSALASTIKHIQKMFGQDSIRYGEGEKVAVDAITSGSLSLDIALGVGGYPEGRIVEIYGEESSGKTTLALHAIAEVQKQGGICALVDTEHAFDPLYSSKIGVNMSELIISQPDYAEQALEIIENLVRSHRVKLVVLDSVAALVPKAEVEGDMGDSHMGLQARLMSQALRKLTSIVHKSSSIVIFINQVRQKIGVMFGNPQTTTGGTALKFYSSVRMEVRRTGTIKKGEESIGNNVKVKIVKNKVAAPFKTVDLEIMYGTGIAKTAEIINLGVQFNIIQKAGSWYSLDGVKIGQGVESVKTYFENNPDIRERVKSKIKTKGMQDGSLYVIGEEHEEDLEPEVKKDLGLETITEEEV
jgi:recombination protein RecA